MFESRHPWLYVPVHPALLHTPTPTKTHYLSFSVTLSHSLYHAHSHSPFFFIFLNHFLLLKPNLFPPPFFSTITLRHLALNTLHYSTTFFIFKLKKPGMQPPSPTTIATTANTHVRLKSSANDFIVRELSPNQE